MNIQAKTQAVDRALAQITALMTENLRQTIRPILEQVFEDGGLENMAAIQRAMNAINPLPTSKPPVSPPEGTALGPTGKDGRAPRGAVRRAVMTLLKGRHPAGATMNEIINSIDRIDPEVSGISARNELTRNKDKYYWQDPKGEWHLMETEVMQADIEDLAETES
ncbi:MAG TPA: hypothetical protein VG900_12585 [Hyphomicrobiaceae bacterium]|nr:hypothetical protein [Hyphomicrobiaceae bacterium]